ncbi:PMEI domain-containing protein [Citrus sinensis]|uniref:PMEI domain-containing protein n=1 Tax=Citrus sinensis TaxID=2711 RepID=A0ACB8HU51_CITSI|nr:PMEI domain-containing protein [Citrus sinensis]
MESSSSKYFLILLAIFYHINSSSASRNVPSKITASTEFIKTSCSSTTYPTLCYKSLARHASLIQTSPKLLAHASLNVTLAMAKSTSAVMLKISKSLGMKPREAEAMQDCLEELSDSVDELRKSIGEMGLIKASNFELTMNDIQTWVSAALTDETTCSDGFEKNTVNGKVVRGQIVKIAHMTSNALALINSYASLHA